MVNPDQDNWDRLLPLVEFAINNAHHESIGTTPFFLNYGQHPRTPASLVVGGEDRVPAAMKEVTEWHDNLQVAKRLLQAAQARQKRYADEKREFVSYVVVVVVCVTP